MPSPSLQPCRVTEPPSSPRYRRAAPLFEAPVGDELVALDEARGLCFGFNETATAVWNALSSPRTVSEICDTLAETYDVEKQACLREIGNLLADMSSEGLIETCG